MLSNFLKTAGAVVVALVAVVMAAARNDGTVAAQVMGPRPTATAITHELYLETGDHFTVVCPEHLTYGYNGVDGIAGVCDSTP